jgi:hypothetical protein
LDHEEDFRERLERLLAVGCNFLATEIGAFWKVAGNTLQIDSQTGGDLLPPDGVFALDKTYAGEVARKRELASFLRAKESWLGDYAAVRPFHAPGDSREGG